MVISQAEGGLPKPQWFISKFDSCIRPVDYKTADGLKIRCNLKCGRRYDYETYQCCMSLEQIKEKLIRDFKEQFLNAELFDDCKEEWVTI